MRQMNNWLAQMKTRSQLKHSWLYSSPCVSRSGTITFVESKDPVRLCLSLHIWKTAMLPHVATCWQIELSALSFLHPAFTRAMALVVLSSSFMWKQHLGLSPVNLGRCLRNHPKTLMSTYACLAGRLLLANWQTCIRQLCRKQRCCLEETLSFFS